MRVNPLKGLPGDGHTQTYPLDCSRRSTHRIPQKTAPPPAAPKSVIGDLKMPVVTWDHVHLRSPDPEATATWLEDILGGQIIRGPGRIDVKLGGAMVFIAPVAAGDGVNAPPVTPYQGLGIEAR